MAKKLCAVALFIILISVFCTAGLSQRYKEKIVFTSYEDGDGEIFLIEGKDGEPVQLTNNNVYDGQPVLSPDGEQIAFVSWAGGVSNIYLVDVKGGKPKQLTRSILKSGFHSPDWSPDGKHIVCVHADGIYIMNDKGRNLTRLADVKGMPRPRWSPDGKSILFTRGQEHNMQIAVVDIGSGEVTKLADINVSSVYNYSPIWSPDGHQIAFSKNVVHAHLYQIYVMDENGENIGKLTDSPAMYSDPVWSPDGTRLAFAHETDDSQSDIYVMDADGSNIRNLTNSPGTEEQPDWSPDGKRLVFVSIEEVLGDIRSTLFIINADGKNRRKLMENSASPDWLRDGRIAFVSLEDGGIYAIDADGGNPELLIDNQGKLRMMFPAWSPDGAKVVYQVVKPDGSVRGVYMSDSDGGNERLTIDVSSSIIKSIKGRCSWSPDGRKIAVSLWDNRGSRLVHVMYVVSGDTVCLGDADTFSRQVNPSFSPDGHRIAFSGRERGLEAGTWIHVMNADGSSPRAIGPVSPITWAGRMTWSPDGSQILFNGFTQNRHSIYRMDMQTGRSEKWLENATDPDWVDPGYFLNVDPRSKLLTLWGKIKQASTE